MHSYESIRELLDVKGCESFVRKFAANQLHTGTPEKDAELMGSLITLCYWYKSCRCK